LKILRTSRETLIAIVILIAVSNCKPREKVVVTEPDRTVDIMALKSTIDDRKENIKTLKFSKIRIEMKMNEEEYKLGGTIGLIRDSIIVISVIPLLGYEMARVYCTKDSILVIDRIDKSFYKLGIDDQLKKLNLSANYDMLQSILMNKPFIYKESSTDRFHENKVVLREGEYVLRSEEKIRDKLYFQQELVVDATHFGIKRIGINDYVRKEEIHIDYDLFSQYEDFYLPEVITVSSNIQNISLSVEMNIGDIEVNQMINAGIRIPSKYKKLNL
jgi:hypothetical protein